MKGRFKKLGIVLFFAIWFLTGWPRILNFPLRIPVAYAAIARVAATPAGVGHTTASTSCANAATAGFGTSSTHTVVIVISLQQGGTVTGVTDNATGGSNTYTKIAVNNANGGHDEIWWSANITRVNAAGLVITAAFTNQRNSCAFKAYTGVVSAAAAITSTNTGGSDTTGTITTTTTSPNSWIISGLSAANGQTTVTQNGGTLDNSWASGNPNTPSTGLVSQTTANQGASVTNSVTWGTAKYWATTALELRSDLINPVVTPNGGSYNNDTSTTLTGSDSGATYCYTTDGSSPAAAIPGTCSAGITYSGAFNVTATATTIRAIATRAGWTNSAMTTSSEFTLTVGAVTSSPGAGTYHSSPQSVTLSIDTTTGATAYYTTDGSAVSCSSTAYSGAFNISTTSTVKAIACKTNYVSSSTISDLYNIVILPTVTTQAASNVKDMTATANGNITATGGETNDKEGFVYDTSSKSLPGNVAPESSGYTSYEENSGSYETGAFIVNLTGLTGGYTYYGRAYSHNSAGYSYGEEVSFTTAIISISITSDGTVSYGFVAPGAQKSTIDLSDTQTAQNTSTIAEDFNIETTNATGGIQWTIGLSAGDKIFVHEFYPAGGSWTKFDTADSYQPFISNVLAGASKNFDLRITVPTITGDLAQKTITVTVQAVAH